MAAEQALAEGNSDLADVLVERLGTIRDEYPVVALHYDYTLNRAAIQQSVRYGESPHQRPPRILYLPAGAVSLLASTTGQELTTQWLSVFKKTAVLLKKYHETDLVAAPPWHKKFNLHDHEQVVGAQTRTIDSLARRACLLAGVAAPEQFYSTD